MFGRFLLVAFCLSSALIISGCREELYSSLSEEDANEAVLTLLRRGVDAEKVSAGKSGFTVTVEKDEMLRALEIMKESSLPKSEFASLGSVFKGEGMISSQTEEKSRLAYAISQELSDTLSRIDGVLDARVHVVLSQHDQATGLITEPSAAVFIRHVPHSAVTDMIAGLKETAARAVPGLSVDRVSVVTEEAVPVVLPPKIKISEWYEKPLYAASAVAGIITALFSAVAAVLYLKGFRLVNLKKDQQERSSEEDQQ